MNILWFWEVRILYFKGGLGLQSVESVRVMLIYLQTLSVQQAIQPWERGDQGWSPPEPAHGNPQPKHLHKGHAARERGHVAQAKVLAAQETGRTAWEMEYVVQAKGHMAQELRYMTQANVSPASHPLALQAHCNVCCKCT